MANHVLRKGHSPASVLALLLAGVALITVAGLHSGGDARAEEEARTQYGSVPTVLSNASAAVGVTDAVPSTSGRSSGTAGVIAEKQSTPAKKVASAPAVPMQYSIRIENEGGSEQLDACTGGFTHLVGFTTTAAVAPQRILAEHNNCGGDVVLALRMGDVVNIQGEGAYEVVASRDTVRDIAPADIKGISGSVLLQTCYHDRPNMRFVGLEKIVA